MKKPLFFLIMLMVLPALVYAGFHFGMADAVKKKVKKLDDKVAEKQKENEEKAIKQLYGDLESSMEREDINAWRSCVSDDYSHQRATKSDWTGNTENLFEYNSNIQISITNLSITVTGNSATASFHWKMSSTESGTFMDANMSANPWGFFSYLVKENGSWKIYGDHAPPTYYVYGGNSPLTGPQVQYPADYGYTLLGSASPWETKTFSGSYNYYEVLVYGKNVIRIDALQKSDTSYWSAVEFTGNVKDWSNLLGAPDGLYATVGPTPATLEMDGWVFISSDGSNSVKVIVVP